MFLKKILKFVLCFFDLVLQDKFHQKVFIMRSLGETYVPEPSVFAILESLDVLLLIACISDIIWFRRDSISSFKMEVSKCSHFNLK